MMCGSTRRSVSVVVFSPRASVKSSLSVENRSCTLLSYSNCKTQRHHERQRRDCLHLISTASGYVNLIFTAHQRSCRKVIFSVVTVRQSVILSMGRGPMWTLPMMHWISPYRTLAPPPPLVHSTPPRKWYQTVQAPPHAPPLLVKSGGQEWRPV